MNLGTKFDPAIFQQDGPIPSDPLVDAIPSNKIPAIKRGMDGAFTIVPAAAYAEASPKFRVLLFLAHSMRMDREDAPGGWYKLGAGAAAEFRLDSKSTRSEAIAALEREDKVEVMRATGKAPLLRMTPSMRAQWQVEARKPRVRTRAAASALPLMQMRITELGADGGVARVTHMPLDGDCGAMIDMPVAAE